MNIIKYILPVTALLTITSCSDYLDVAPVGKMIPTEVSQYENLLNNSYTVMDFMIDGPSRFSAYSMLGDNTRLSENHVKYQYTTSGSNLSLLAAYIFNDPIWEPTNQNYAWTSGLWLPMGYFNNVIEGVAKIDPDSDYSKGVIAQGRAGRAWLYLNAAMAYGPIYDPSQANDTKILPIRTSGEPTVANGPLRSTVDILSLVKEDLDYACANTPVNVINPSRANRTAAYALRAEYHMFMRDWENMLADTRKAWSLALEEKGSVDALIYNLGDFEYRKTSTTRPAAGVDERYYMKLYGPDDDFTRTRNRENLLYRKPPIGAKYQQFYPSEDWMNIFDKETDLRWLQFAMMSPGYSKKVGSETHADGVQISYFRESNMSMTQGISYPILLLEKAEAEARTGNLTDALNSLNTLRRYRYKSTDTNLAGGESMNQVQLLNEILNERRREQPLVSFQRVLDIKRYSIDNGMPWCKETIEHKAGDKVYSTSVTGKMFRSLPIDNGVIEFNPEWGLQPNLEPWEPYDKI